MFSLPHDEAASLHGMGASFVVTGIGHNVSLVLCLIMGLLL